MQMARARGAQFRDMRGGGGCKASETITSVAPFENSKSTERIQTMRGRHGMMVPRCCDTAKPRCLEVLDASSGSVSRESRQRWSRVQVAIAAWRLQQRVAPPDGHAPGHAPAILRPCTGHHGAAGWLTRPGFLMAMVTLKKGDPHRLTGTGWVV